MEQYKKSNTPFEDFLKEVHAEDNPTLLDDDMSDHFDDWLGSLDGEDYIKYGDQFAKILLGVIK